MSRYFRFALALVVLTSAAIVCSAVLAGAPEARAQSYLPYNPTNPYPPTEPFLETPEHADDQGGPSASTVAALPYGGPFSADTLFAGGVGAFGFGAAAPQLPAVTSSAERNALAATGIRLHGVLSFAFFLIGVGGVTLIASRNRDPKIVALATISPGASDS